MRIPRRIQLSPITGIVHKYWRCHNREFLLLANKMKDLYFKCVKRALKKEICDDNIQIHAYCAMDNHFHKLMRYFNGHSWLSSFMRQAHSLFGRLFNDMNSRSGKVADSRPKTPLIENIEHALRCQFYIEANPIRAGKYNFENLKLYKYSSFGYYAYGIENEYTDILTPPPWYLELGKTPQQRQRKYRQLFAQYLREDVTPSSRYLNCFIGSAHWANEQRTLCLESIKIKNIEAATQNGPISTALDTT